MDTSPRPEKNQNNNKKLYWFFFLKSEVFRALVNSAGWWPYTDLLSVCRFQSSFVSDIFIYPGIGKDWMWQAEWGGVVWWALDSYCLPVRFYLPRVSPASGCHCVNSYHASGLTLDMAFSFSLTPLAMCVGILQYIYFSTCCLVSWSMIDLSLTPFQNNQWVCSAFQFGSSA